MANPFNTSNFGQVNMQQVKHIFNMLKNSNNPNELLNNLIQQNPKMAQTINLIRNNSSNYEQVFRDMCKQRGINADDFMRNLMGNNT